MSFHLNRVDSGETMLDCVRSSENLGSAECSGGRVSVVFTDDCVSSSLQAALYVGAASIVWSLSPNFAFSAFGCGFAGDR